MRRAVAKLVFGCVFGAELSYPEHGFADDLIVVA